MISNCLKCGDPIVDRKPEAKYCSARCAKLYLKSEYRKRNKEKLNTYKNEYRRAKNGGNRPPQYPAKLREDFCLKCGSTEDLQLAHIKPLWAGGIHKHVITLCRPHHSKFDNILREFWQSEL